MKNFHFIKGKGLTRQCLLFLICLLPIFLQAQNQIKIRGIIKDQATQLPLEGVNIRIHQTYSGTITDSKGVFELRVKSLPVVLLVSHIAYFGRQIIVTQPQADSLLILLSHRPINLEETEITAETYKVFKGKRQEIIDYGFLDSNILILAYNFNTNKNELILTDEGFDTLCIADVSGLKNPGQIYRDCMGNCHLFTKDTAYQVFYSDSKLFLIYPTPLKKFYNILADCLFETPCCLAFEGNTDQSANLRYAARDLYDLPNIRPGDNDKWKHLFFLVNKETHEKIVLDRVYEWEKKRDAYDHALFVFADPLNKRSFGDILRGEEMIFFKPAFQSLKFLNNSIYYFNHLKSRIEIYSEDLSLQDTIHIDYHNRKNWKPVIITDEVQNRAYTIFALGAKLSLSEIDLTNGTLKEVHTIEKLFPEKIKLHNGYLYFLYRDVNNVWGTKMLFQGELPATKH